MNDRDKAVVVKRALEADGNMDAAKQARVSLPSHKYPRSLEGCLRDTPSSLGEDDTCDENIHLKTRQHSSVNVHVPREEPTPIILCTTYMYKRINK